MRQMHEKWLKALTEIELLKASMIFGHFLFEAVMKVPSSSLKQGSPEIMAASPQEPTPFSLRVVFSIYLRLKATSGQGWQGYMPP